MFPLTRWLGAASAVSMLGAGGMAGLATAADAAPAPSATALSAAGLAQVGTDALPNVNIKGAPAKWSPTRLSVTPKNFTRCTKAKTVWTISNKTKKRQTISFKVGSGKRTALGTLPAGKKAGVCSKGKKGTRETFFIKGSKSTLRLTLK